MARIHEEVLSDGIELPPLLLCSILTYMRDEKLPLKEINYVYKWTVVSLSVTSICLFAYLIYKLRAGLMKSTIDIIIEIGLLVGLVPVMVSFLVFEVLSFKKLHQPLSLCIRRFVGRTIILCGLLLFLISLLMLASNMNLLKPETAICYGVLIWLTWLGLTFIILTKFKRIIQKLSEGDW